MLFSGNSRECLDHFATSFRERGIDAEDVIQSFTSASLDTVEDWVRKDRLPNGENLLRLVNLLEFVGYEVKTSHKPEGYVKDIARLIAFRVIGFDDMMHALEYATRDTLFGVLCGRDGVSEMRITKMREIFSEYYILLAEEESKLSHLREKISSSAIKQTEEKSRQLLLENKIEKVPVAKIYTTPSTNGSGHKMIISTLAGLINLARPLADQLLKDDFSDDEREELRRLTGGDGVFKTGNLLGRLSSETARAHSKK